MFGSSFWLGLFVPLFFSILVFYFCSFCVAVFFCPFFCLAFSCAFLLTLSNLDVSIVAKSFSFYAIKRGFFLRLSRSLAIFLSALLGFVCFSFGAIEKSIWACMCLCVWVFVWQKFYFCRFFFTSSLALQYRAKWQKKSSNFTTLYVHVQSLYRHTHISKWQCNTSKPKQKIDFFYTAINSMQFTNVYSKESTTTTKKTVIKRLPTHLQHLFISHQIHH